MGGIRSASRLLPGASDLMVLKILTFGQYAPLRQRPSEPMSDDILEIEEGPIILRSNAWNFKLDGGHLGAFGNNRRALVAGR